MRLRAKLEKLVQGTLPGRAKPPPRDFAADKELKGRINERMNMSVIKFCSQRPTFDQKHGLVYRSLGTDRERLRNGVLTSHDMHKWLRKNLLVPALWVVRLAGPKAGRVPRNQLLQWLRDNERFDESDKILRWTKKWGFVDDARTLVLTSRPTSVAKAREIYRAADLDAKSKQILGNKLLQQVIHQDPEEVFAFYRILDKDVRTFQIVIGAMLPDRGLTKFKEQVWKTMQNMAREKTLRVDGKLKETLIARGLPGDPLYSPTSEPAARSSNHQS